MQLPIFPKPIFKKLTIIGFLLIAFIYVGTRYGSISELAYIPLLVIWLGLLVFGTFKISSGVYLTPVCEVKTEEKVIALTFDDGPNENTQAVLELLKKYNAKASFFITSMNAKKLPEMVKEIHSDGHQIGNHSHTHSNQFPLFPLDRIIAEIKVCNGILKDLTGEEPKLFRPPFGVTNPRLATAIEKTNMNPIGWSVRSLDTKIKDTEKVIQRIIKRTKPGSIILLHEYVENSALILEQILLYYSKLNYKFVSIAELMAAPKQ